MSDSLFGDLDLDNAPDDPFAIPDGTYKAYLTDVRKGPTKDGKKVGVTFKFKISEGDHKDQEVTEWKSANPTDDVRTKSFLKQRIIGLGVPADRISVIDPEDLIGKEVYITTKSRNGFTNIQNAVPVDAGESSGATKGVFDM